VVRNSQLDDCSGNRFYSCAPVLTDVDWSPAGFLPFAPDKIPALIAKRELETRTYGALTSGPIAAAAHRIATNNGASPTTALKVAETAMAAEQTGAAFAFAGANRGVPASEAMKDLPRLPAVQSLSPSMLGLGPPRANDRVLDKITAKAEARETFQQALGCPTPERAYLLTWSDSDTAARSLFP
jgi:hypothetical protein